MKVKSVVGLGILLSILSGCSWFTPPLEKPIIEDHSHKGKVTTFATIPSRRMVIVKMKEKNNEPPILICAEPSPDVSDNIASSLAVALSGKTKEDIEIAASLSKSLATTAQYLFKRSQGLQLYRDGMYNLCQAYINGIITGEEYKEEADKLRDIAVKIIEAEIPLMNSGSKGNSSQASGATASSNATVTQGTTASSNATATAKSH